MSMYNMLFGVNPFSKVYLALVGLDIDRVGRFRDCFIRRSGEELQILVWTRNGGPNRDEYEEVTDALRKNPNYVEDYDDTFDSTYAGYVFKVPDDVKDVVKTMTEIHDNQIVDPSERFKALIEKLQNGNENDPDVKRAMEAGKKILSPVLETLNAETKKAES